MNAYGSAQKAIDSGLMPSDVLAIKAFRTSKWEALVTGAFVGDTGLLIVNVYNPTASAIDGLSAFVTLLHR